MSTDVSFLADPVSYSLAAFLVRWAIALSWLPYGINKWRNPKAAATFPAVFFLSSPQSYRIAAIMEVAVPACLLLGFLTRPAAIAGIGTMAIATRVSLQPGFLSPALPILLTLIAILFIGPGHFSLDFLFWG